LENQKTKSHCFYIVVFTLLLAGLACNLPSQNPTPDPSVVRQPPDETRVEERVFGDDLITLAVPNSYFVGDPDDDLSALADRAGLPAEVDLTGLLGDAQADILVWGYDVESPTSFVVIKNEDYAAMPLGIISNYAGSIMGDRVEILQEDRLTIAGRDTLRWITLTSEAGVEFTQAVYLFKDAGVLYLVVFNADRQAVAAQLSNYDAIVASLRIDKLE